MNSIMYRPSKEIKIKYNQPTTPPFLVRTQSFHHFLCQLNVSYLFLTSCYNMSPQITTPFRILESATRTRPFWKTPPLFRRHLPVCNMELRRKFLVLTWWWLDEFRPCWAWHTWWRWHTLITWWHTWWRLLDEFRPSFDMMLFLVMGYPIPFHSPTLALALPISYTLSYPLP
jgi:hypothetical protein